MVRHNAVVQAGVEVDLVVDLKEAALLDAVVARHLAVGAHPGHECESIRCNDRAKETVYWHVSFLSTCHAMIMLSYAFSPRRIC